MIFIAWTKTYSHISCHHIILLFIFPVAHWGTIMNDVAAHGNISQTKKNNHLSRTSYDWNRSGSGHYSVQATFINEVNVTRLISMLLNLSTQRIAETDEKMFVSTYSWWYTFRAFCVMTPWRNEVTAWRLVKLITHVICEIRWHSKLSTLAGNVSWIAQKKIKIWWFSSWGPSRTPGWPLWVGDSPRPRECWSHPDKNESVWNG